MCESASIGRLGGSFNIDHGPQEIQMCDKKGGWASHRNATLLKRPSSSRPTDVDNTNLMKRNQISWAIYRWREQAAVACMCGVEEGLVTTDRWCVEQMGVRLGEEKISSE